MYVGSTLNLSPVQLYGPLKNNFGTAFFNRNKSVVSKPPSMDLSSNMSFCMINNYNTANSVYSEVMSCNLIWEDYEWVSSFVTLC